MTPPDPNELLAALRQLLDVIERTGGFMTHEDQAAVMVARMLVGTAASAQADAKR